MTAIQIINSTARIVPQKMNVVRLPNLALLRLSERCPNSGKRKIASKLSKPMMMPYSAYCIPKTRCKMSGMM